MKRWLSMRVVLWITLAAATICAAGIIAFNLVFIPRGYHLLAHVNNPKPGEEGAKGWVDAITHPLLSKMIFRHTGNYCDAPTSYRGESFFGKDWTIPLMIQSLTEPQVRREEALSILERAAAVCDVNATAENDVMPHLFTAIFYGEPDAVRLLLNSGANPNHQLRMPGKSVDGMNALQYAKRRLEKQAVPSTCSSTPTSWNCCRPMLLTLARQRRQVHETAMHRSSIA
ncbi:MAG: hypothetical protein RLZZ618_1857 [Pseudomonadota bacterium]|jgi:hypothetical protein